MNEAIVAKIETDMRERVIACVEEDEIADLQIVEADIGADLAQLPRGTRQCHAGDLLEHIANEPAAVESADGRVAAIAIADTDETECELAEIPRVVPDARSGASRALTSGIDKGARGRVVRVRGIGHHGERHQRQA